MPISYSIDKPNRIAIININGSISADELFHSAADLRSDPNFKNEYARLVCMGNSEIAIPSTQRLQFHKSFAKQFTDRIGNIAIVSTNPVEVANGMIFRSQVHEEHKVMIFSTKKAALEWLRRPIELAV